MKFHKLLYSKGQKVMSEANSSLHKYSPSRGAPVLPSWQFRSTSQDKKFRTSMRFPLISPLKQKVVPESLQGFGKLF